MDSKVKYLDSLKEIHDTLESIANSDAKNMQRNKIVFLKQNYDILVEEIKSNVVMDENLELLDELIEEDNKYFEELLPVYTKLEESWAYDPFDKNYRKGDRTDFKFINAKTAADKLGRVYTDGKSVYSMMSFRPGEILEICPCKLVGLDALYSKDMRDIVFEIIPNKKYAVPFGNALAYDLANEDQPANCDYMFDANMNALVIKASEPIKKNQKLILVNM